MIQLFDIYWSNVVYKEDFMEAKPRSRRHPSLIVKILPGNIYVTIAMITSTESNRYYKIRDWKYAGLDHQSYINFKEPRYMKQDNLEDYIGHLSDYDIQRIKSQKLIKEFFKEFDNIEEDLKPNEIKYYKIGLGSF